MAVFAHGLGDACSELIPLQSPFFVSDAPQDDRRVVPVAADHASEKLSMFLVDACKAVLLDDEDAETVAYVQQSWSHRVMARAVCVASELLQLHEPPLLECVWDAAAHSGVVLVHVHALELHHLTVEEEAPVVVECYVSDAGCGLIAVDEIAVGIDLGHNLI